MDRLRNIREKRRIIKNELYRVERYQEAVGSNSITGKAKGALQKIRGKEEGTYRPREDPDIFTNAELKPRNLHKCYADIQYNEYISDENTAIEKGEAHMETVNKERFGTVYDDKKVDWKKFVESQKEFYSSRN